MNEKASDHMGGQSGVDCASAALASEILGGRLNELYEALHVEESWTGGICAVGAAWWSCSWRRRAVSDVKNRSDSEQGQFPAVQ